MISKNKIPKEKTLDSTVSLLNEGYLFIGNRVKKFNSDIFMTRLLGQKVICMTGEPAVILFYNPEFFKRKDAAPKRIQKTLFGENAIQTMDDEVHIHRKQLFLSLMTPLHQKQLSELVTKNWEESIIKWKEKEKIILFEEAKRILCISACQWAGIPLAQSEIKTRADDFSALVDAFGAIGPRHWKGRIARNKTEKWIKDIINNIRIGRVKAEQDSILHAVAFYKNLDGSQMDEKMAAIELINILRPIVAISTFITFAALALYEHTEYKEKIIKNENNYFKMFIQEVRRYYPFAPFVGAIVRKDFNWNQYEFKKGTLALLDIYGVNHDERTWMHPNKFNPENFKDRDQNFFDFIPQGGGDASKTHRCPGESITISVMEASLSFLIHKIRYEVPLQDFSYSLSRIPTLPKSGFIMTNIKSVYR